MIWLPSGLMGEICPEAAMFVSESEPIQAQAAAFERESAAKDSANGDKRPGAVGKGKWTF
jgi:hypothetical protein